MRDIKTVSAWRAAEAFDIPEVEGCAEYGRGHKNLTYLVHAGRKRYIMQAVSSHVSADADAQMHNIVCVCRALSKRVVDRGGVPGRHCLSLVYTRGGKPYFTDPEGIRWRMYPFIEATVSRSMPESLNELYEAARALGTFTADLSSMNTAELKDTAPELHNTKEYLNRLLSAEKDASPEKKRMAAAELEFAAAREEHCRILYDYVRTRSVPRRAVHNDPTPENVLLDSFTGTALAVTDFDLVMPGTLCWDFGGFICTVCCSGDADGDISKVHFSMEAFSVCTEGYMFAMAPYLTRVETRMLAEGVRLMAYERGMRYLTDYLSGDGKTDKASDEEHLFRCRVQFRLVQEVEEHMKEMKQIIFGMNSKYRSNDLYK